MLAQVAASPVAPTVAPEAAPAAPMPVTSAPDLIAAPAATPTPEFAPSQPVVQATPPLEERIAAATAAAEAEQAAVQAAKPRPMLARSVPRTVERTAEPVAARAGAVTPVAPAPVETAPPVQSTPAIAPAQEAAPAASAAQSVARSDQAMLWALGGGAMLLLGLGGAALMRRRRPDEAVADARVAPVTTFEPAPVPVTPARAITPRPALATAQTENATLEAMVAAAPSADNPFLTRTKRLRRAQHLIAQREAFSVAAPAPQTMHAEPVPAAAIDRSQTVYRFGNDRAPSGFLKPRTR
ncbi:hypothetical protein HHL08_00995 [Sphingobium sp. AR-3-1]|uniref:LPXTG cell wall anchor domain-containing protein n=1 Tax=Sphingobium psychrophilum TaxID=2728834 RepID=A0A7X9WRT6_9SPHN|nr:hypothetical protein [Sphingobium psychrophilum]